MNKQVTFKYSADTIQLALDTLNQDLNKEKELANFKHKPLSASSLLLVRQIKDIEKILNGELPTSIDDMCRSLDRDQDPQYQKYLELKQFYEGD